MPLNENSRIALRDAQKQKALDIENKRRKAKGEEVLSSLEPDTEHSDDDSDPLAANADGNDIDQKDKAEIEIEIEEEDFTDDVLLMEAGHVLVDALLIKKRRYALHHDNETVH